MTQTLTTTPPTQTPALLGEAEIARLRRMASRSLFFFAKGVLGFSKLTTGLHLPICLRLEQPTWQELMVVLPRGWFKSTLCTIATPLWLACREGLKSSNIRVLIVQNSQTNAEKKLGAIADLVLRNPLFRLLYPDVLPTKQSTWRADSICLNRTQNHPEGTFECAGTRTKTISRHYDLIIEDDTVAPDLDQVREENLLPSRDDIAQAIGFHQQTFCLRVTPKSSRQLVVGTRWFDHDLISHIKEREPSFEVIEHGATETNGVIDPNGQPVFPEEFDLETLSKIKMRLGPYLYNCNPGEAPILMGDFTSRPIRDVKVGDTVVGFTLPMSSTATENMSLTPTKVVAVGSRVSPVVKITLMSGRVIRCTPDHKWLADFHHRRTRPHLVYQPAQIMKPLHYICDPMVPEISQTRDLGWLAGIYDGEGSCTNAIVIAQSQSHNPAVAKRIRDVLTQFGYSWTRSQCDENKEGDATFLAGGWEERRRFLLQVAPTRTKQIIDSLYRARFVKESDLVLDIEPDGEETVYSLQTETGNYICWGYASKNCLYLNLPTNSANMTFKREWFRYYDTEPKGLYTFTTVDLASDPDTAKGQPDFNVVMTCGVSPVDGGIYILDYFRKQCSPGETIEALLSHVRMWGVVKVGIGAVAYENTFLYWLRRSMVERRQYFLVEKVAQSHRSKAAKIMGLQPVFASGCLHHRPWMRELENELLIFPLGRNDDLADALSMQLELWQVTRNLAAHQEPEIDPIEDPTSFEGARLRIAARQGPRLGLQVTEWEGSDLVMAGSDQGYTPDYLDN